MADAAMTVLLETLSHLLESCSDLTSGAEDELRRLRNDVESSRTFLRHVANKPKEEKPFREIETQIEAAIYDAQDTVDFHLIEAAAAQSKIDLFCRNSRRRRQVTVTELRSSLPEMIRFIREKVKLIMDEARIDFTNMLLIEEMGVDADLEVLLESISNLYMNLGGDLISAAAEEDLWRLKYELEWLSVFLWKAANYEPIQEELLTVTESERRINEFIDEAENITNCFLTEASAAKNKRSTLAEVVRLVREEKVKPVLEKARVDFAKMPLIAGGSETDVEAEPHGIRVNKVWSIGEERSLGIEDEQAIITGYLKQKTEELDFISIIGTAGLGKTTLARKVYQSQEIQYEFPTRIWVTLSHLSDSKGAFLNILKEVSSKDMSSMSDRELVEAVHNFLEKRKFLLVLDNVWTPDSFDAIEMALPYRNCSGKVLITSRSKSVGYRASISTKPHHMRFLGEDESWELLQLQVFGGFHICPPELIEIGQHIALKSGGVPLLAVIVGGILLDQLSKTQSISAVKKAWIQVLELMTSDSPYLFEGMLKLLLELSSNRLSDELRILFLYLGIFPVDYEISATTLTRLWIAEGFIQYQEGRSLEDIAEENLRHLIERKLVIVDKVRSNGKVKSCRLHDTVRGFCIRKGMQVDLFREILTSREREEKKHRRLCIHSNPLRFFSSKPYIPGVRSFSCYYKTELELLPEDTSKIPGDAFELVRVLDIKPIRFTRFPLELTQLFCLRYIVLSSDFKILPEAISMLRNMQTLMIHTLSRTLEIKFDIWKMMQLRHVQTNASIILRKEPENHSDQELHTLTNLSPENCTNNVFDRAHCLKKLGIRGILSILLDGEVGTRKFDNFEKLKELENLKLLNDVHMSSPSKCRLSCLPPAGNFPAKLRSLTLSATLLTWEHMVVLGRLENLEVLKLKDNAFVGECWEVVDSGFRSLQVLQIGYTNLVYWKAADDHFPKLRSLALKNCEKLEALPQGLENVPSLEEIELLRPTKAATAFARKIEERRQIGGNATRFKLSIFFPVDE